MHDVELGRVYMDATETNTYDSRGLRAVVVASLRELGDRYKAAGEHVGGMTTMAAFVIAEADRLEAGL